MGIIRYIAEGEITEQEPEGAYRYSSETGYGCYSRLKIEETEYNKATKVSKVKVSLEVKTASSIGWSDGDYFRLDRLDVAINGSDVSWTKYGRTRGTEWSVIADGVATLAARSPAERDCTVTVHISNSSYQPVNGEYTAWATQSATMYKVAKLGDYTMPLTKVDDGSKVYIGGDAYNVYIGDGSEWVKQDVYISDGNSWVKH